MLNLFDLMCLTKVSGQLLGSIFCMIFPVVVP